MLRELWVRLYALSISQVFPKTDLEVHQYKFRVLYLGTVHKPISRDKYVVRFQTQLLDLEYNNIHRSELCKRTQF